MLDPVERHTMAAMFNMEISIHCDRASKLPTFECETAPCIGLLDAARWNAYG